MSAELEECVAELVERLDKKDQEKPSWSKFNLGTIITVTVLAVTSIGWIYTLKAEVSSIKKDQEKIITVQEKHSEEITDVKLKGVLDQSDIRHIKEQVDKMDKKLDQLLKVESE